MSRFMGSGTVGATGAAAGVGIGLTCDVGMKCDGNIVEIKVGGRITGRNLKTAASAVSVVFELIADRYVGFWDGLHQRIEAAWSSTTSF